MDIARYWGNSEDWYTDWGNYTQNTFGRCPTWRHRSESVQGRVCGADRVCAREQGMNKGSLLGCHYLYQYYF